MAAENFRKAAERQGVRKIIYLGGLGSTGTELSAHLASRQEVGRILGEGCYCGDRSEGRGDHRFWLGFL